MTRTRSWLAPAMVFVAALIFLLLLMPREIDLFDEGIILAGAMRVTAGEIPHRDFYTSYGPAPFYIIAALWKLLPDQMFAARLYGVGVEAGIAALAFALVCRRAGLGFAILTAILVVRTMLAHSMYLYPALPPVLLALAGAWLVTRPGGATRSTPLLLAGATAGAAALFRYDAGPFVLLALALSVAVPPMLDRRFITAIRSVAFMTAGAAIVFVPVTAALLASGAWPGFSADIIDYALNWYPSMRGLPFPGPLSIFWVPSTFLGVYFPFGLVLVAAPAVIARLRDDRARPPYDGAPMILVLTLLTALLSYKGLVRVELLHSVMATLVGLPLVPLVVRFWWSSGWRLIGWRIGPSIAAATLVVAVFPTMPMLIETLAGAVARPETRLIGAILDQPNGVASRCPIRPGLGVFAAAPEHWLASRFLARHSRPGERVYVGTLRHDRVHKNAATMYFLADRLPGTRWQQLDPGEITRVDVQRRVIAELRRADVRWVVRDASFETVTEPNASALSSGVHLLDGYLDRVYRPVARAGLVVLWLRRDQPDPARSAGDCR